MILTAPCRIRRWRLTALIGLLAVAIAAPAAVLGAPTTAASADVAAARHRDLLPNLQMAPLRDLRIQQPLDQPGRTLLRFTTTMVNAGAGPLEMHGKRQPGAKTMRTWQRIFQTGGTYRDVPTKVTASFASAQGHDHWHFARMQRYQLWSTASPGGPVLRGAKIGFCFEDGVQVRYDLPGAPTTPVYEGCGRRSSTRITVGISVGWADIYDWAVAYQWIDITGLASGDYRMCITANPRGVLHEATRKDNETWTDITLDMSASPPTVEILQQRRQTCR